VPASALRAFAIGVGVTKYNSVTDIAVFEHCIREDLNRRALRRLAVLRPLKVVIENYPESQVEMLEAVNNPEDASAGTRQVPFSRVLYIEQDDFREVPPPKYYRLSPGTEVRLRYAYLITCTGIVKDPQTGAIIEIQAKYNPATRGGNTPDGRKVKATLHWVSAAHAVDAEVRLYDKLFTVPEPDATGDFRANLNPHSLETVTGKCEPSLADATPNARYQFERLGYFALDTDSRLGKLVFNRTITLKDAWTKIEKKQP
jgi:glutaminyl-tRNA synthetase